MAFFQQTGYTLPGGDLSLEHGRVLHKGNCPSVKTLSANAERSTFPASNVQSALTGERWKPFANELLSPSALAESDWTAAGGVVGSDGATFTQDGTTGAHSVTQAKTFTAAEYVVAAKVRRSTTGEIRLVANDGTTDFAAYFDLRSETAGTATAGVDAEIYIVGDDEYMCRIAFTAAAGTGSVSIRASNGSESDSFAGDDESDFAVVQMVAHLSVATLSLETFAAAPADMFAIAGHNLGSGLGDLALLHDSNADDTYTELDEISAGDDSPLMYLFAPVTSARWQIEVSKCVLPEIAVVRVGMALQLEQRTLQGNAPFQYARATELAGNVSETGEWIGRSTIRSNLRGQVRLSLLTQAWIRANVSGRFGMLLSMEQEPFFYAWRPSDNVDAHYCWTTGPVPAPVIDQRPYLSSWQFSVVALGYE